jgi:hypothetical protein
MSAQTQTALARRHFNMQSYSGRQSQRANIALLLLFAAACGGSNEPFAHSDAGTDSGSQSNGDKGGVGAAGVGGGGGTFPGTAGDSGAAQPIMMTTCSESVPTTPVTCGGEVCEAPVFGGNPCIIPCCVTQAGKEMCASKSAAIGFSTECVLAAVADPRCPEIEAPATALATSLGLMGGVFQGCCNAGQHKCGVISGVRPGCFTESMLVTLPELQACGEAADDGGTDVDGG